MNTTKRLPVSIAFADFQPKRSEFLVPFLEGAHGDEFLGVEGGHSATFGAVSYIGREITADDLIGELLANGTMIGDHETARKVLDDYVKNLQKFKIGDIIRIKYGAEGAFQLYRVPKRPAVVNKPLRSP